MIKKIAFFLIIGGMFLACGTDTFTPKPRGYFRISFPDKKYQKLDTVLPFTFNYPTYSEVDITLKENNEYWTNITFPREKAYMHLTYKRVNNNIETCLEDAYTLAYKHTIRADAIGESVYANDTTKVYGLFYDIQGDAASSIQFFLTDSVKHFLRGALYFNVHPNKDSLAPVVQFLDKDVVEIMESVRWKN